MWISRIPYEKMSILVLYCGLSSSASDAWHVAWSARSLCHSKQLKRVEMKDLGHTKVSDLCGQIICQKDIIGREITMNNWWGMAMEVVHSQELDNIGGPKLAEQAILFSKPTNCIANSLTADTLSIQICAELLPRTSKSIIVNFFFLSIIIHVQVKQGAVLSPLLYSLFVNNLLLELEQSGLGILWSSNVRR